MKRPALAGLALICLALSGPVRAADPGNPLQEGPTWPELRPAVLGDRAVEPGPAPFAVEAPYRAADAATVPVRVSQPEGAPRLATLSLIVDENPAPVAAEFTFGPGMARLDIETRIRVDSYSNVRAIGATGDGRVYMDGRFVKASGGCSAPPSKDPLHALADLGRMRVKPIGDAGAAAAGEEREAQIMLRHPNNSGLQMDQMSRLFVPARFIDELEVRQGGELIFRVEGGISLSENPSFRFRYLDNGVPMLTIRAIDTDGAVFEAELPKAGGMT